MDDLSRQLAAAPDRAALEALVEAHAKGRAGAGEVVVYLMQPDGHFAASRRPLPPGLERLPRELPTGAIWSPDEDQAGGALAHAPLLELLAALEPEQLVPIPDRQQRLVGLIVLGRRAEAAPDPEGDARALRAVAEQAGVTLEVLQRAEALAERMEADRRADREMGIARDVQRRLLPQHRPSLTTLELAACCEQARSVGGDYYDYLDVGEDQTVLVLADVSGKGMPAALRMANLQAHLRSQLASAPRDPLRALRQVNRMLCEASEPGHFATLFLGVYSDATRRLRYINCGHNPPLCLRGDGRVERLHATATVLGSFEDWSCTLGRTELAAGDLLVVYSDGVTEAGRGDELFGEARLIEVLRSLAGEPLDAMLAGLLGRVEAFSDGSSVDDLTLLLARGR